MISVFCTRIDTTDYYCCIISAILDQALELQVHYRYLYYVLVLLSRLYLQFVMASCVLVRMFGIHTGIAPLRQQLHSPVLIPGEVLPCKPEDVRRLFFDNGPDEPVQQRHHLWMLLEIACLVRSDTVLLTTVSQNIGNV